jgi:phosphoenolpyruvate-protein kinase (PTS system EI component)
MKAMVNDRADDLRKIVKRFCQQISRRDESRRDAALLYGLEFLA